MGREGGRAGVPAWSLVGEKGAHGNVVEVTATPDVVCESAGLRKHLAQECVRA